MTAAKRSPVLLDHLVLDEALDPVQEFRFDDELCINVVVSGDSAGYPAIDLDGLNKTATAAPGGED
jgi:hypothetical protein